MDAEDLLQETWTKVYLSLQGEQTIDNPTAWLYTTAKNKITDYYRHKIVQQRVMLQGAEAELQTRKVGAEDRVTLDDDRIWQAIETGLSRLPEAQRHIFVATEMEDRSFREMAGELDEPIGTLLSRKHHATRKLKKYLNVIYQEIFNSI